MLTGADAVRVLADARSKGLVTWELGVGTKSEMSTSPLVFRVTIVGRKRRKDGTVGNYGSKWDVPWYSDSYDHADRALIRAADRVLDLYPEVKRP